MLCRLCRQSGCLPTHIPWHSSCTLDVVSLHYNLGIHLKKSMKNEKCFHCSNCTKYQKLTHLHLLLMWKSEPCLHYLCFSGKKTQDCPNYSLLVRSHQPSFEHCRRILKKNERINFTYQDCQNVEEYFECCSNWKFLLHYQVLLLGVQQTRKGNI